MIGRRLSHFETREAIGSGGMGVVYKAVDLRLQRTVALKLLRTDVGLDAESRRRFFREAQAASALNHPNIVTVYEVDSAEGVDFIAMEHLQGSSLDALIAAGPLGLSPALGYAVQVADALASAHAAGIVHRDLKPSNVIVTPEGRVKVLDFGIAKRLVAAPEGAELAMPTLDLPPQTDTGVVMGTPRYMSPEQAQGKKVDARSDIFAFGVLLYEMLAGRPPFTGDSLAGLLTAILRDPPPSLRSVRSELPAEVEEIVAKTLEKDPERRYQSMRDVLRELERLRQTPSAGMAMPPSPSRRKPVLVSFLVGAAVVVLGSGLALLVRGRHGAAPALRFRQMADLPGSPRSPGFSLDGRMIAYVDDADGVPQVWVTYLRGGAPLQVTSGPAPAARPRWSPKGDAIVFERRGQGIWTVSPLGGQARQIVEGGSCPGFFADGERIMYGRGAEIWTARLDGGEPRRLEGLPPSDYYAGYTSRCPALSPDGREIVFFQAENGPNGDLWSLPAGGGELRRLTFDSTEASSPVWTPDGRFIVFSSARRGSRNLWRIAAGGGQPEPVTTGAGDDLEPDVAAGNAIVYTSTRIAYRLMVLDPAHGQEREVLERRAEMNGPAFSPQGDRIAFFGVTGSGTHLFTVRADGSDLRQVTQAERERNVMPQWSGDGSSLYYYCQLPSPSYRKIPAAGGMSTAVVEGWTWEGHGGARWDPGERLLAYTLIEGDRAKATLVRDAETRAEQALGRAFYSPKWSPDGAVLLGNDGDGHILVCPRDGSGCRVVGEGRSASWSGDASRIYFERPGRRLDDPGLRSRELWVMEPDGRNPRRVAVLEPQHILATPVAVSREDLVAWVQVRRAKPELWLAEPDR